MRSALPHATVLLFALLLMPLVGCTNADGRIPIQGMVTYRGTPLAKGYITFIPSDPSKGGTEGAPIADGKYAIPADKGLRPGGYHVSISSVQSRGSVDAGAAPGAPRGARETLPAKYNARSTLKIDVTADGKRDFDFALD